MNKNSVIVLLSLGLVLFAGAGTVGIVVLQYRAARASDLATREVEKAQQQSEDSRRTAAAKLSDAQSRLAQAEKQIQELRSELLAAKRAQNDGSRKLAQRESRLAALEEELTRVNAFATAFGELRPEHRRQVTDIAEKMAGRGLDVLSNEERRLLDSVLLNRSPRTDAVGRKALLQALTDSNFTQALRALGMRSPDTIKEEMAKLRED